MTTIYCTVTCSFPSKNKGVITAWSRVWSQSVITVWSRVKTFYAWSRCDHGVMLVDHGKTCDHSQEKFQGVITVKCMITVKAVITPAIINLFSRPEGDIRRRLYDKHSTFFLFLLTYSKHKIQLPTSLVSHQCKSARTCEFPIALLKKVIYCPLFSTFTSLWSRYMQQTYKKIRIANQNLQCVKWFLEQILVKHTCRPSDHFIKYELRNHSPVIMNILFCLI